MENLLFMFVFGLLACVGVVQMLSWVAIRLGSRRGRVLRVFPIGGKDANTDAQLAQMYSCLQWEANPSRQIYVLMDMGLDEQGARDCTALANGANVLFVRSMSELEAVMRNLH